MGINLGKKTRIAENREFNPTESSPVNCLGLQSLMDWSGGRGGGPPSEKLSPDDTLESIRKIDGYFLSRSMENS